MRRAMLCILLLALAVAEEAASRPAQTCSRPSSCETQAVERAATPVTPAGDGFDWRDAGVGAGAGFGLALVGGACVLAIRRVHLD
jgi:hypothetical protein